MRGRSRSPSHSRRGYSRSPRRSRSTLRDDYRRNRRSHSRATTIRSSHSPPPRRPLPPSTPEIPYGTPPVSNTHASTTAERENTRLTPSGPRALRTESPNKAEEAFNTSRINEPTHDPSSLGPAHALPQVIRSKPSPSEEIAISTATPTLTTPQVINTSTTSLSTSPQVQSPTASFIVAPIPPIATSPNIQSAKPNITPSMPPNPPRPPTPTRTSSIANLDSILETLRLQNSIPNMPPPPLPVLNLAPAPPTQSPPPMPTVPPPMSPTTGKAGQSSGISQSATLTAESNNSRDLSSKDEDERKNWEERIE